MKMIGRYIDVSERALLSVEGHDGLDLLQRISTNEISKLKIGEHAQTVLTTDKGRMVDVVTLFRRSETSLILAGHTKGSSQLSEWISRFIVMEDVHLSPLAHGWRQILLFGIQDISLSDYQTNENCLIAKLKHPCAVQALMVVNDGVGTNFEEFRTAKGIENTTIQEFEQYRIQHKIPGFPNEICGQFNPLELGLDYLVSYSKGCYVGQEVIARLDTYQKVQRKLTSFELSAVPGRVPLDLYAREQEKVGVLTSYVGAAGKGDQILGLGLVMNDYSDKELIFSMLENDFSGTAKPFSQ